MTNEERSTLEGGISKGFGRGSAGHIYGKYGKYTRKYRKKREVERNTCRKNNRLLQGNRKESKKLIEDKGFS